MSIKLRELIRNVRACKTAAEERAVIAKECALIRTSFKDEDSVFRHRNVAKVLFIHMLGYPSHFGQMECLKLIASARFLDKRIGYLALSILVDEKSEVLTLVTNSLSSDLSHRNPYIQGLALSALGNISNTDMLRDLSSVVLKLFSETNVYVRKKAALCGVQIFKKVPDMVEDFVGPTVSLLGDRNHAVLLTAVSLLIDIAMNHPSFIKKLRKAVPQLVKVLKSLVLSGYAPEYDVNGITDPFLQVSLIELLGLLGEGHAGASEQMNDILAQISTNTEGNRNSGNAILYESVRTILKMDCEDGLRVLAINTLGRFLTNRDNNIRYVALETLQIVVNVENDAVQRHRETIVECLRDPDVSIRVRALDLVFALISRDSIEELSRELLNYLVIATSEQKKDLCSRLSQLAFKFYTDKAWQVNMLTSMMCIAGREAPNDTWETLVSLIGQPESEYFRPQILHRLFESLSEDASQTGLVNAAVWSIGEFGALLLNGAPRSSDSTFNGGSMDEYEGKTEDEVISLLLSIRTRHDITVGGKGLILTSFVKLASRFPDSHSRLAAIVNTYSTSMSLELQTRACEYFALLNDPSDRSLLNDWLAPMPVPTDEEMEERRVTAHHQVAEGSDSEEDDDDQGSDSEEEEKPKKKSSKVAASAASSNLLDLDDIFGGGSSVPSNPAPPQSSNQLDLLSGIFGGTPPPAAPQSDDPFGMFGGESFPEMNAYNKNGLSVKFQLQRGSGDKQSIVTAYYSNSNGEEISNFVFQAAVPKFISLKMDTPTGNSLPPFNAGTATQKILLVNSMQGTKPIVMKVKIVYSIGGQTVEDQATVSGFPVNL